MKSLILIIILGFLSFNISATHLIGGNLGYEYIGQFGSNYRYKIILTTYTNCDATSNIPEPEGPTLTIGVYGQDIQNDPMGGGNKQWITDATITLVDSNRIDPSLPGNCPIGGDVCIYKAIYEGFVDVPLNFNGYHVFYERCCRNGSIVNLIPSESMAFHAYMPSPLLPNSSPVFTDDPVPFLCSGDTTTILNSAFDPDGDLLVFSFVTPYNGFESQVNPAPLPPQPNLGWNIPSVTYSNGYSTSSPFGTGGYSFINGSTGLTSYYSPSTGDYVVAVEIREYRNGNLIGVTRRDLQLLVLNCSPNGTPALSNSLGTTSTSHRVTEGESICFDFGFDDPEGDSISLEVNGQIFDANFVNPPATVNSPVADLDTVSTSFCWTTVCGQAQSLPYQFQVSATDNGCPPKSNNSVFQITVDPVAPPDTIIGPEIVCENSTQTYSTQAISNTSYNWSINGGTIVNNNGSSVEVLWGSSGAGIVTLSATNQFGCNSLPISLNITKTSGPFVDAGSDVSICSGDSILLNANVSASNFYTINWNPSINIINPSTLTPTVYPSTTTDYVLTINMGGGSCVDTDTIRVNVTQGQINAGADVTICMNDSVQLNATGATSYNWTPNIAISDVSINNPYVAPLSSQDYIVTGVEANGCLGKDTISVLVNSLPSVSAGSDVSICEGSSTTLNATGGISYSWTPSTSLSSSSIANPSTNTTVDIVYNVQVTDMNGCIGEDFVNVLVNPIPSINAGLDTEVCDGSSIQLQASGGLSYLWNSDVTLSNTTIANPIASPSIVTDYVVTGTDANSCFSSDTVRVSVNQLPNVSAGNDVSICFFDTVQLNVTGSASSYSWSPSVNISSTTVFNPFVSPNVDQDYIVTGTDINNCLSSDTVKVVVNALPVANAGEDLWVCPGSSKTLNGSGGSLYAWTPNVEITDTTISNPVITPSSSMDYILQISDVNGCIDSDTLSVIYGNLVPTDAGLDTTICLGDTVTIGGNPTSVFGSDYAWNNSGSMIDTTESNPIVYPVLSTDYIVYTSNDTCSGTDTIKVTVNQLPLVSAGNDVQICKGDSISLNASGAVTYLWNNELLLTDELIENPIAFPQDTTHFIVIGVGANGCEQEDSVTVLVNPLPVADAGIDELICYGDSIQLQALGGSEYVWTPDLNINDDSVQSPWVSTLVNETYYVKVTDSNDCINNDSIVITVAPLPIIEAGSDTLICVNDTVQLMASGADDYAWYTDLTLSDTSINDPLAFPLNSTNYIVEGTETVNGCHNTDTVTVFIQQSPVLTTSPTTSICIGDSLQLTVSGGDEYAWFPNVAISDTTIENPIVYPTVTITYLVSAIDNIGCGSQGQVTVVVNELPVIEANPSSVVNICKSDTVQLQASGAEDYTWSPEQTLNSNIVSNPLAFPESTTNYTVVGTDVNGCVDSATVTVEVFEVTTIADTTVCEGSSVQLNVGGAPGNSYLWTPSNGLNDPNIAAPVVIPFTTTTYTVSVTDAAGCEDEANVTISTLLAPQPDVTTSTKADCDGTTIQFQNNTVNATSYNWSFGDGTSTTEESPIHLFGYDGTYSAVLVTSNAIGCTDTLSLFGNTLVFSELFSTQAPNVFTPNDDGENDVFEVSLNPDIEECTSFVVFNRWGQLVFESEGSSIVWDGKKESGRKVPEGTYFYIIDLNGVVYKGTMAIFR